MRDAIGVDVSKDYLDVHHVGTEVHRRLANDTSGLRALCKGGGGTRWRCRRVRSVRGLSPGPRTRPGGWGADIRQGQSAPGPSLRRSGRPSRQDRPRAGRSPRQKGVALHLEPTSALPEHMSELQDLLVCRRGLVKDRTAAQARLETAGPKLLRRLLAQRLARIERQIGSVDGAVQAITGPDPDPCGRMETLASSPGISAVSATALLVDRPELGRMSGQQAAALAGLAPMSRQAGQWQGHERIQGGPGLGPPVPLHAGAERDPAPQLSQGDVRTARRRRQAAQTRPHRDHAKTPRHGQCTPSRRSQLD